MNNFLSFFIEVYVSEVSEYIQKLALASPWLDLVYLYYFKRERIHVHFSTQKILQCYGRSRLYSFLLEQFIIIYSVQIHLLNHSVWHVLSQCQ